MAERVDYELTAAEAAVLESATKDAMGAAGAYGGDIGTQTDIPGGRKVGGATGRFMARFLRPHTAESIVEAAQDPGAVLELARRSIAQHGSLIDDPNGAGDGAVWGLVGSGSLDMSPALLRVAAVPAAGGGSRVHVRGTGRESLVKQRIGAKAVDRLCAAIAGDPPG